MKKLTVILLLMVLMTIPVSAAQPVAPEAPDAVQDMLPEEGDISLGKDLWHIISTSLSILRPDLGKAIATCFCVVAAVLMISMLRSFDGKGRMAVEMGGVIAVSCLLLEPTNTMVGISVDTVQQLRDYTTLLLPVMTSVLTAQGGVVTAAGLYTATALINSLLSIVISSVFVPMVYIFLVLCVVNGAVGDELIGKLTGFVKWLIQWGLKLILYGFTAYIGITGIISGTTDQAALKATKLTISGMVPVVGSILSDASETILVSAGVVKNSVGIYGLLVVLAIAIGPFFRIGLQYLLVKLTAAVCTVFSDKKTTAIIGDFSGAMGLLLAMTGTMCLILLISVVCFLKGVG